MQIQLLKSKIQRAVITEANLNYIGSITIDEYVMDVGETRKFKPAIVFPKEGNKL